MRNFTFWFVFAALIFLIVELLRRKVLREKYALVWIAFAIALVLGAIFPNLVNRLSQLLGFQILSNFLLFLFGLINLLIVMQLTLSIGKAEDQIQTLAEEVGLLKEKFRKD